jgi:hypothetical protein
MRATRLIVSVLWIAACSTDRPRDEPAASPNSAGQPSHAVQNARLHDLMTEMNSLMFDRIRTELDIDRERRRRTAQIAEVARAMSGMIDGILATLPDLNLAPAEQTSFASLANRLRNQARQLEEQARRNSVDAIPHTLDQMTLTCMACHRLFRNTGE